MNTSRLYRNGQLISGKFDSDEISELIQEPEVTLWIDLQNPTEAELQHIGDEFGLHELAVADAFKGRQRPKLDHYDTHLFINAYQTVFNRETYELDTAEISVFVTDKALITVRDDDKFDISKLEARWDESAALAKNGVAFLLWGLLDVIVDGYFEVVQQLDDEIENLEDLLFAEARQDLVIQKLSYELR
jgi:magnesium transporter